MELDQCLSRWSLADPHLIARTATSTVWDVRQADGQMAVLKLLKPGQTEEARGAVYLLALSGQGAVQIYARDASAILMEHCLGPSLGDLVRSGQDDEATDTLCSVIQTLHAARPDPTDLEPLATRFAPLTTASLDGDLAVAAGIARDLLANPAPARALHGDLHHDNVLHSSRGWLAIDPKGVWGDPAYEPANAFRNPDGFGERLVRPIAHPPPGRPLCPPPWPAPAPPPRLGRCPLRAFHPLVAGSRAVHRRRPAPSAASTGRPRKTLAAYG